MLGTRIVIVASRKIRVVSFSRRMRVTTLDRQVWRVAGG
jgi:hypothetical protein